MQANIYTLYDTIIIIDLAESDLAYTRAITGNGRQNYTDKTVLILGKYSSIQDLLIQSN